MEKFVRLIRKFVSTVFVPTRFALYYKLYYSILRLIESRVNKFIGFTERNYSSTWLQLQFDLINLKYELISKHTVVLGRKGNFKRNQYRF